MTKIIPWLLTGALAASTGLNLYHVQGAAVDEAAPDRPATGCKTQMITKVATVTGSKCCPSVNKLCLTRDQKRQFEECCPTYFRQCEESRTKLDELVDDLETELNAEVPNQERVYELADEIGKVRTGELKSRIRTILQVRQTLTPEQLVKLITLAKGK